MSPKRDNRCRRLLGDFKPPFPIARAVLRREHLYPVQPLVHQETEDASQALYSLGVCQCGRSPDRMQESNTIARCRFGSFDPGKAIVAEVTLEGVLCVFHVTSFGHRSSDMWPAHCAACYLHHAFPTNVYAQLSQPSHRAFRSFDASITQVGKKVLQAGRAGVHKMADQVDV